MAYKLLVLVTGLMTASAVGAVQNETVSAGYGAPAGSPDTRYCMRIESPTGTRLEELKCWTRQEWANHDVDVDLDWAKEGVRTIG